MKSGLYVPGGRHTPWTLSLKRGLFTHSSLKILADSDSQILYRMELITVARPSICRRGPREMCNLELIENDDIPPALEQVDYMDTLTRSLLELSQMEGIPSEIQHQKIDLAHLLRDLDVTMPHRPNKPN